MTTLTFAVLLQASLCVQGSETYAEARRVTGETGQPMVVMVGADWCAACQVMEKQVLPEARQRGLLGKVAFAVVNLDHDKQLGQQLTAGGPIPQLIMYRQTQNGWKRRVLVGRQSVETVATFIEEGVARQAADGVVAGGDSRPKVQAAPAPAPAAVKKSETAAAADSTSPRS